MRFIDTDKTYNMVSFQVLGDECEIRVYDKGNLRFIRNKPHFKPINTFIIPVKELRFSKDYKRVRNEGRGTIDKVWTYTVKNR